MLRPTAFAQSLDPCRIARDGELPVPQGAARTPYVDVRDIADVAVGVLTEAGHEGRIYDLTGPEALSGPELAELIGDVFGRSVSCRYPGDPEAYRSLLSRGMDEAAARSLVAHWQSYRARPVTLLSGWTEIIALAPATRAQGLSRGVPCRRPVHPRRDRRRHRGTEDEFAHRAGLSPEDPAFARPRPRGARDLSKRRDP